MDIHILDVGCGSMALVLNPDGTRHVIDCNITEENKSVILAYTGRIFGRGNSIDAFINTHRDADHMRGIEYLHGQHKIKEIWDTGVPGTTIDSPEYLAYMRLRRTVTSVTIDPRTYVDRGTAKYRYMSGKWNDYSDVNEQSAVIKIEYKYTGCSVLFAGDTNYRPWREKILPHYSDNDLKCSLLVAAHHGSITFFDDPSDTQHYYEAHIRKVSPAMTLVSVGSNQHGLPDKKAMEIYEKHTRGSADGQKIAKTEDKRHMKITLKDDGGWSLNYNQ